MTPNDSDQYFVMGNYRIVINEHFKDEGKTLKSILEQVILDAGKEPQSRINTVNLT